jgi:hypothetical protein
MTKAAHRPQQGVPVRVHSLSAEGFHPADAGGFRFCFVYRLGSHKLVVGPFRFRVAAMKMRFGRLITTNGCGVEPAGEKKPGDPSQKQLARKTPLYYARKF